SIQDVRINTMRNIKHMLRSFRSSQTNSRSGNEASPERQIAEHFLIVPVEDIFHSYVCRSKTRKFICQGSVGNGIAWITRQRHAVREEITVRAPAHRSSTPLGAPCWTNPGYGDVPRVTRPSQ